MANPALLRRIRHLAAEFAPARWLVRGAARLVAPTHRIGAVGAVFDDRGRVLIVEHAFRTDFPWGLPGGWVERGEDPRRAVERELREELGLQIEVRDLVLCETVGRVRTSTHPEHLGFAYYCRLESGGKEPALEVLGFEWTDPARITRELSTFQKNAIAGAARLHDALGPRRC